MRPRGLALASLLCLLPAALAAADEPSVREKQVDGETVFTMRPTRRPDAALPAAPMGPRKAPPAEIEAIVADASSRHGMDPRLVTTVIGVESGFNALAVSPKGARGLMQLMPQTARQYGVQNLHDPRENIEGGVAYLKDLTRRYNGDLRLALAAYNAGPEAVERASGVPNFQETRDYLRKIEARYGVLALGGASGGGGTVPRRVGGAIRTAVGESGEVVYTNARAPGTRVMSRRQ
jgi:SLT domain-containing protein